MWSLADHERIEDWEIRRYRPSGIWAWLGRTGSNGAGRSRETSGAIGAIGRPSAAARTINRAVLGIGALRRWIFWPHTVRGWWSTLARELRPADLYHATGSLTVAAALAARARTPIGPGGLPAQVIYDAIDDVMESNNVLDMPAVIRRFHARRETGWARAADSLVTVNEPIAARLAKRWARPLVVVPNYPEIAAGPVVRSVAGPGDGPLRRELGLPPETRIVLFQGRIGPRLGLDEAADAILAVPGAVLVILGFGRGFDATRARDTEQPWAGRHFTLAARDPDDLLDWTADADVALIPLPPVSINQRLSSPNKFWEALGAGTPIVVPAPLTYMAELVERHDLGVVARSASASDLATALSVALERLAGDPEWRTRIRDQAARSWTWPVAEREFLGLIRSLATRPRP